MPLFYVFELASFVAVYFLAGLKSQNRGRCQVETDIMPALDKTMKQYSRNKRHRKSMGTH